MAKEKQERYQLDPRTWLLLCLLGIASIILIHSEIGGLCIFLCCIFIHFLLGKPVMHSHIFLCYLIFTGIAWVGVMLVENNAIFFGEFYVIKHRYHRPQGNYSLAFAACLAKEPTGSLMAALQAMRSPKAVGIAASVVLRFFPTISGEYRAIRSSQRFRGIGVGVVHTLTHLPSTVEYILIPLILRTTKVAEELSASMTVRGVRFSGETISYRPIHFSWKDGALCVFMMVIAGAVFVLEKGGVL